VVIGGEEMKKKYMKLVLDEDLHRELKLYSVQTERTMNDIVVELIRRHLQEEAKGGVDQPKEDR
jgi:hypothetical protein